MRVLITGADGFVGQHLVAELLEHGFTISAATLDLPPIRSTLTPAQSSAVDWKAADVRDHDALFRLISATLPERIYHLAGFASGALARAQAADAVTVNVGGTVNLCEAVVAAREDFPEFDPRILVMGSGDSYGDAARETALLTEQMPLRPVSAYGLSKAAQELAAHTYRRAHGLQVFVARGFSLIGPGQEPPFVVPDFCSQVASISAGRSEPVLRVGNLHIERDFTDVRDGVRALRLMMDLEDARAAYNVASGEPVRIASLLEWILDEAGVRAEIRVDPSRLRREEVARVGGDASLLRAETGWVPERRVEETVREVYRWTAGRFHR